MRMQLGVTISKNSTLVPFLCSSSVSDLLTFQYSAIVPKEEGQDKDCVTYDQYAAKIKSNLDISNETDSLQVNLIVSV